MKDSTLPLNEYLGMCASTHPSPSFRWHHISKSHHWIHSHIHTFVPTCYHISKNESTNTSFELRIGHYFIIEKGKPRKDPWICLSLAHVYWALRLFAIYITRLVLRRLFIHSCICLLIIKQWKFHPLGSRQKKLSHSFSGAGRGAWGKVNVYSNRFHLVEVWERGGHSMQACRARFSSQSGLTYTSIPFIAKKKSASHRAGSLCSSFISPFALFKQ